jgi:hypothetical protein
MTFNLGTCRMIDDKEMQEARRTKSFLSKQYHHEIETDGFDLPSMPQRMVGLLIINGKDLFWARK